MGHASILRGSRFLKLTQQLLEEFCDVTGHGIYAEKMATYLTLMESPMETRSTTGVVEDLLSCGDGGKVQRKYSRLISMLKLDRTRQSERQPSSG